MLNRITAPLEFHSQALQLRAERQRLIASNIANADTPGFVARDFNFASALRQATSSPGGNQLGASIFTRTDGDAVRAADPTLRYAMPAQTNLDSNSVDMDRERATFADNAVRYEATLRFMNGSLRTLQDAMKSHTQA